MAQEQLILQLKARGVTLTKKQLDKLDKSAKKAGTSMKGMIGAVGGIYALGKAFSYVARVGTEFSSAQSNLAAILMASTPLSAVILSHFFIKNEKINFPQITNCGRKQKRTQQSI